ncbi:MAG: PDZ domain-containing protein [Microthrixaceae bacterium]
MPSGTQDDPNGSGDGREDVPVHPDDRLWIHPSELARRRASTEALDESPAAPPDRRRIPTSLVVAVGLVALLAAPVGLMALAQRPSGESAPAAGAATPTPSTVTVPQAHIIAGDSEHPGVVVHPRGMVMTGMADPPTHVTLQVGQRDSDATLASSSDGLGLAVYRVDGPTKNWPVPPSKDLSATNGWTMSRWGPLPAADLGNHEVGSGLPVGVDGEVVAVTARTEGGRTVAVPWRALRRVAEVIVGDATDVTLPATVSDSGRRVTVTATSDRDLRVGDELVAVDGQPVRSAAEVQVLVGLHQPGDRAQVGCRRSGKDVSVAVEVAERAG